MYTISKSDKERILMGLTTGLAWAKDTAANVNSINHAIDLINNLPPQAQPTAGEEGNEFEKYPKLAARIQHMAAHATNYSMEKWHLFLGDINASLIQAARSNQAQSQNAAGLVDKQEKCQCGYEKPCSGGCR